ncbi:MAG: DinB family protein [Verrucomicrobiales bacterium]|nr:DinB family protein [Verrucomicrobiales bacterium]
MPTLWTACEAYLIQARDLVDRLSPAQYDVAHANCFGASIGGHIRHCAEHFEIFRTGLEAGRIDYDARARGTADESDPVIAGERLGELAAWFSNHENIAEAGKAVQVQVNCGDSVCEWQGSTVGRELQFLVSHTVHHFAIIGIMCEAQGIELALNFGVAPSTLLAREMELEEQRAHRA